MSLPYKFMNSFLVNLMLYFMSNLRREPGPFFFFLLISMSMMLAMSMFFRWFASLTKKIDQALAPSAIILLALVLYTGFAIPVSYMRGWASWIRWLNPVSYGFEAVMVNEFHGREFPCSSFVPAGPGYEAVSSTQRVCSTVGAVPGSDVVSGDAFVRSSYGYINSHRWRNFGIIIAMTVFLAMCHFVTTELVASKRSKGEVLVFRRGSAHIARAKQAQCDEERPTASAVQNEKYSEAPTPVAGVEEQTSIFHWEDVCYDVKIKSETRRILDHVDGWIKPGTLTALMGVSGAGKTTLLDVLASRTTVGVVIQLIFQIIPSFVTQRTLYESRERQSKAYSWQAFVLSNIVVEFAWNTRGSTPSASTATQNTPTRSIPGAPSPSSSSGPHSSLPALLHTSALANIMGIMMYAFCGILAGPHALPRFWIFMYRVNPFTYLVSGLLSKSLGDAPMHCADNEFLAFSPPANRTCGEYMERYIAAAGGYLLDSGAQGDDQCRIDFGTRWRDFGLLWVYVAFNTFGAVFLYWLCRVPKGKKRL
ncbi:hypothetical protein Aspvir_004985 [Aspergillus viridinutans]|uniref:ABC transporter domain-containing protein n=1 Tax=Aspergillus viridinutans TaxID=75553 RepID=A0A9P3F3W0_ASPVI|nr:uncharacterized protein Aspvir_004985 [Aspergillus viridinutans]GIK00955.1 hypothetical protein Aspvir_004985 [Aspergillus viridinutans]